jgi:general secretion pathway protein A
VSTQLDSLQPGGAASGASGTSASASAGAGASAAPNDAIWRSRVSAFQLSQGLKPDGLAGPTTFMQLNRATGVDEPRLHADQPAS